MPRRSLSQRSFYDPEVVQPDCLEPGTVPWLLGARRWAKATGASLEQVAFEWAAPHILGKSTKGHFRIDWSKAEKQTAAVETVAQGALRVIEQDFETDERGRLVIARRVAEDRLISLTDPCARHGRKSKSQAFNGFKMHVLGDIVSGLISSVCVSAGNRHDGSVAHRLIRRAKSLCAAIDFVLGDTAYGGATLRHQVQHELHVKIVAPPPPTTQRRENGLRSEDIVVDFEAHTASCAAGITTDDHRRVWSTEHQCYVSAFSWPKEQCAACPLRQRCCGDRQGGHHVRLHPHEQELRQARQDWQDPQVRELYRRRSQCERLVNQVVRHGGRRARGWGLGSAQLQAHLIAMRCNLHLLARVLAAQEQAKRSAA